jgi:hypothetical protein
MLVVYLAYFSTLKMEAERSSETSVNFCQTIRRRIPEDIVHENKLHFESNVLLYVSFPKNHTEYCDVLPEAGILKSGYTAIASQRLRQTLSRCNGQVGY